MRNITIAIIAIVIGCCLFSAATADEETKKCVPGTQFLDDKKCNTCWCGEDGTVSCTKKACVTIPITQGDVRQKRQIKQACEPNSRFKDDCNSCICSADGMRAMCTRKRCIPTDGRQARVIREVQQCEPGKSFPAEDGCNTCSCNADGTVGGCTEKLCIQNVNIAHLRQTRQANQECEPSSRFLDADGCNWCNCRADGKGAACTRKLCLKKSTGDRAVRKTRAATATCIPGETFKQTCNTCRCAPDGKSASCTTNLCPQSFARKRRDTALLDGQVCVPNSRFRDAADCNNCICNDMGTAAACTLKFCYKPERKSRSVSEVEPVCVPNSTFKQDCNTCICNEDGTSAACTERGCHDELKISRSVRQVQKVCEPNSTFKQDCNTCFCNEDGTHAGCTMMECQAKICKPNEVTRAQDSCNTCRCNEDGTAKDCTTVSCPSLAGPVETVCTPNSVFKQDCNTCKCSKEGDKAFCTRRICRNKRNTGDNEEKDMEVAAQPTPCTPDDIKIEVR